MIDLKKIVKNLLKTGLDAVPIPSELARIRKPVIIYRCGMGRCKFHDHVELYYKPTSYMRMKGVWACEYCYYSSWDYDDDVKPDDALTLTLWLKYHDKGEMK